MHITVNGQRTAVPEAVQSIQELLQHYQLAERIVIVECNKEIISKEQYATTALHDGDTLEIVHFVGGG